MTANQFHWLIVIISSLFLSCSESTVESSANHSKNLSKSRFIAGSNYVVKETFDVGKNVFVRSLSLNEVTNTIWVGTSVGALMVDINTSSVAKTITRTNGLANEYVFAIFNDKQGTTWFGTNGGGVSTTYQNQWKTYFPMHGLADYWVYSFAEQENEAMWIGTWAGLSKYNYQTKLFTNYVKELVNEWVYGLAVDSKNHVWVGTEGGVNMFNGKQWYVWTHKDGLGAENFQKLDNSTNTGLGTRSRHNLSVLVNGVESYNPNYVFCIVVDEKDRVWAGTWGGGVSYYDGTTWKNLTTAQGLAGNIVYSMTIDSKGVYWFGTNKGVSRYDGIHWQNYGTAQGLLDQHVYALAATKSGQIWAGTRHGVAVLEVNH